MDFRFDDKCICRDQMEKPEPIPWTKNLKVQKKVLELEDFGLSFPYSFIFKMHI